MGLLSGCGRGFGGAVVLGGILISSVPGLGSASAAGDWTAQFITSSSPWNDLDSPPALDSVGNVVSVWERHAQDELPYVYVGRSGDGGENWTVGNLRSTAAIAGTVDRDPVVTTDKAGTWLTVWSSNDSLAGSVGSDYDVLFSRSVDAGATWSVPQVLNSTAAMDMGDDTQPWVSMDGAGNCVAAWTSDNDVADVSGTTMTKTCVWVSRSADGGATWSPATAMTGEDDERLAEPRLANGGMGRFGMVWTGRTGAETTGTVNFAFTDNGGTSWTETSIVNNDAGSTIPAGLGLDPEVASDGNNHWMIVWNSGNITGGGSPVATQIARTPDNGVTWLPIVSTSNGYDQLSPSIYSDGAGSWVMGSHKSFGFNQVFSSQNFGASWLLSGSFPSTKPPVPNFPEAQESTPYVWKSTAGAWRALFGKGPIGVQGNPDDKHEIRRATFLSAAVPPISNDWSEARNYLDGANLLHGSEPELASDASKAWVAVYSTIPAGGNGDQEIGFSRSTNGGQSWTNSQILNSDWQTDSLKDEAPAIAGGIGPVWLCVWARSDGYIRLARSEDHGVTWSAPGLANVAGGAPIAGFTPGVSCMGAHKWIITWNTSDTIYTSVSGDDGNIWGTPVAVQSDYQTGFCGNTSPCSATTVSGPRIFSSPGYFTVFAGFGTNTTNRPNGYSGTTEYYSGIGGRRSDNGGATYLGSQSPYAPGYSGSNEMAVDDKDNWMYASGAVFGKSVDHGVSFSGVSIPAVAGRTYTWGKVAMDYAGHYLRMWGNQQNTGLGSSVRLFPMVSISEDAGQTWSAENRIDTANANGSNDPVDLKVNGSANGDFVAVWQTAAGTLLFSSLNKYQKTEAAGDWMLYL